MLNHPLEHGRAANDTTHRVLSLWWSNYLDLIVERADAVIDPEHAKILSCHVSKKYEGTESKSQRRLSINDPHEITVITDDPDFYLVQDDGRLTAVYISQAFTFSPR